MGKLSRIAMLVILGLACFAFQANASSKTYLVGGSYDAESSNYYLNWTPSSSGGEMSFAVNTSDNPLPANAAITGIKVEVMRRADSYYNVTGLGAELAGGTHHQSGAWSTNPETVTFGSASDKWGNSSFDPEYINGGYLYLALTFDNCDYMTKDGAFLGYVAVTIYYTGNTKYLVAGAYDAEAIHYYQNWTPSSSGGEMNFEVATWDDPLPADATITGIKVEVMRRADSYYNVTGLGAELAGGTHHQSGAWSTNPETVTFGSASDKWGNSSFDPEYINGGYLYLALTFDNYDYMTKDGAFLGYVAVTIYY